VNGSILLADNKKPGAAETARARHRRVQLPCGNDLTQALFTLAEARAILDNPVLDKRYQQTPLGWDIARYLSWKEHEWGAAEDTLRDYEPPLAWLALDNPTVGILDFTPPAGIELCRECLARHWRDRSPRTKKKVRSIWNDFFDWAIRECGLPGNPSRALTVPKARDVERKTFTENTVKQVLGRQEYVADWVLCFLVLRYGLRRSGIRNIRLGDFDFEKRELIVRTKGGRVYPLPIVEAHFWRRLAELQLEAQLSEEDYLLYRQDTRRRKVPLDAADEVLQVGRQRVGYANVTTRAHGPERLSVQAVHRWWYRCLQLAGHVEAGVTSGANMHRGRHTAGRDLQRAHHDLKLTQLMLGHRDVGTTSIYSDLDTLDLATALREMNRADDFGVYEDNAEKEAL
jgi:integrase